MHTVCHCAILRAATRRLTAEYDAALAPVGINIAQYILLRSIQRGQPVCLTNLGKVAELDRSTVGRNIRILQQAGLAATEPCEKDHRQALVSLTARGEELLAAAVPAWEACQLRIEERLGAGRLDELRQALAVL